MVNTQGYEECILESQEGTFCLDRLFEDLCEIKNKITEELEEIMLQS